MRVSAFIFILGLSLASAGVVTAQGRGTGSRTSIRSSDKDSGHVRWIHSDENGRFEVESEGDVSFLADDTGVEKISPGGYLRILSSVGRHDVSLRITPGAGGSLEYDYRIDGRRVEYDAAARRETAELFLRVIRETGINVDQRVARFLAEGGPGAVFAEVANIRSGSSVQRYLAALVSQGRLDSDDLARAAKVAEDRIASSGSRARFLSDVAPQYLNSEAQVAYFDAIRSIDSSGDKARTLKAVLQESPNANSLRLVVEVANTIQSSGDHSRVLIELLDRDVLEPATTHAVLNSIRQINSSGDASRVLIASVRHVHSDELVDAYLSAAETIRSSGDRGRVLTAIMDR